MQILTYIISMFLFKYLCSLFSAKPVPGVFFFCARFVQYVAAHDQQMIARHGGSELLVDSVWGWQ